MYYLYNKITSCGKKGINEKTILRVKSAEIPLSCVFKFENNSKTLLSKTLSNMNRFLKFC